MIPIADHMRTVFKDTDRGFDQYLAKVQANYGYIKSCKRGCAACCELFNLITWPEAAIIAEQLRADGRLSQFLPRLHKAARQACYQGVDHASYWRRHLACPFLLPKINDCAIYTVRPLSCRVYVSFSPAELCVLRGKSAPKILQPDTGKIQTQVLFPTLERMFIAGFDKAFDLAPLAVMTLAALREVGVRPARRSIAPATWLHRYGHHMYQTYREMKAAGGRQSVEPPLISGALAQSH
jgi:Fe-S-cluster containining protein